MVSGLVDHFVVITYIFIYSAKLPFLNIGATHGSTLARQELEGDAATQTILFIGDGSLYAPFLSEVHNKFLTCPQSNDGPGAI